MTVGIIGGGTMGSGIAQVAATAGCMVNLYDTNQIALDKAKASLEKILNRLIEKGRIDTNEKTRIQNNINYVGSLKELSDSNLTIEAIIENLDIKQKVFLELENYVSEECIIASNTSSLSIASIAASLKNPKRCVGIHFFNPAPLMKLVEVIPAIQTSYEVLEKIIDTITSWKKTVAVTKDTPGFIVNRVARPFYGEALRIYEEGIADFETIDYSLKTLGGFRMGPFELMDFNSYDFFAASEGIFHREEPWNMDVMTKAFPEEHDFIKPFEVVCSGVMGGKKDSLVKTLRMQQKLVDGALHGHDIRDQAAFNILIYNLAYKYYS